MSEIKLTTKVVHKHLKDNLRVIYGPTEEGWKDRPYQWVRYIDCGCEKVEQPPITTRHLSSKEKEGR